MLVLAVFYMNIAMIIAVLVSHGTLQDFKGDLFDAGRAVLHGHNPYRMEFVASRAAAIRSGIDGARQFDFSVPIYPAPILVAMVTLGALPYWIAATIFTLLSASAIVVAMRLLGIRDPRCIAAALLSWPTMYALKMGAIGPLLLLGSAALWRWRDRMWPAACALASIVVAKLFPWPLAVWMLVTRRWRPLLLASALGLVAVLAAWALIGFAGMASYPGMLANLAYIEENRGVSLIGELLALGAPITAARLVALSGAATLLVCSWWVARRRHGEREAIGLAVMAALMASPIVWEHYMVLMFLPIAMIAPGFSCWWLLPMASGLLESWLASFGPGPASIPLAWSLIEAVVVARLIRGSGSGNQPRLDPIAPTRAAGAEVRGIPGTAYASTWSWSRSQPSDKSGSHLVG
jgi:hypothetical protein